MKKHITDMPHCWCNPKKEVFPNGAMHIIHNEINNNMDIQSVDDKSLVNKTIDMALETSRNPLENLNLMAQIEIGKNEILRRLSLQANP